MHFYTQPNIAIRYSFGLVVPWRKFTSDGLCPAHAQLWIYCRDPAHFSRSCFFLEYYYICVDCLMFCYIRRRRRRFLKESWDMNFRLFKHWSIFQPTDRPHSMNNNKSEFRLVVLHIKCLYVIVIENVPFNASCNLINE